MISKPIELMIVGVQKAGTSSLQKYIGSHPEICTHQKKEFGFFVMEQEYCLGYDNIYPTYFDNYKADINQKILAKNVGIIYFPEAIKRLYNHNSNARIVVLLRNPIDRAYSAYWFLRRKGWEEIANFESALAAEANRLKQGGLTNYMCAYLDRGIYHKQLELLWQYFSKDQVQVFLLEDMISNPVQVCKKIFEKIGVDSSFVPDVSRSYNQSAIPRFYSLSKIINSVNELKFKPLFNNVAIQKFGVYFKDQAISFNEKTFSPPPIDSQTRKDLVDYFRVHNSKLSELIGRNLEHWNK